MAPGLSQRAADDTAGRINTACRLSQPCRALFVRVQRCDAAVPHVQCFYKYLSPAIFHRLRWAIGGSCFQDVLVAKRTRAYTEARRPTVRESCRELRMAVGAAARGEIFASGFRRRVSLRGAIQRLRLTFRTIWIKGSECRRTRSPRMVVNGTRVVSHYKTQRRDASFSCAQSSRSDAILNVELCQFAAQVLVVMDVYVYRDG